MATNGAKAAYEQLLKLLQEKDSSDDEDEADPQPPLDDYTLYQAGPLQAQVKEINKHLALLPRAPGKPAVYLPLRKAMALVKQSEDEPTPNNTLAKKNVRKEHKKNK